MCCCSYGEMQLEVQADGRDRPSGEGWSWTSTQDSRRLPPQKVANYVLLRLRTGRVGVVVTGSALWSPALMKLFHGLRGGSETVGVASAHMALFHVQLRKDTSGGPAPMAAGSRAKKRISPEGEQKA